MINKKEKTIKTSKGNNLPLGTSYNKSAVNFSIYLSNEKECRLNIYLKGDLKKAYSIILSNTYKEGNIFSVALVGFDYNKYEYMYEVRGREFVDPYAKIIRGRDKWGKYLSDEENKLVRGGFSFEDFNWEEDKKSYHQLSELILYRLHVRGFTKHESSKVKHKGTYLGIIEKIPYLKELGINGVEILPIQEFDEIMKKQGLSLEIYKDKLEQSKQDINYWGYEEATSYFAPKASYASEAENAVSELKTMIKALHHNGIEVILEMNFVPKTNQNLIFDCLRYWAIEYHIDGFKIDKEHVPATLVATDPVLSHVKLFTSYWNTEDTYKGGFTPEYKNLANYNNDFLITTRKFLKSDEGQVEKFLFLNKYNPLKHGVINYITNTNGFTLMDLVSYDIKHNEANGENNKDGSEYNYSWNCGAEGKTRRKKILELRKKQIKNGLFSLILSQGTPLILAGDEFGNSQEGNNNPYCQDNEITWLNWNLTKRNLDILNFVKKLISLRQDHPIIRSEKELRVMDYISCGYPDISYHGTKAWYPDFSNYSRILGIMLCGKYIKINRNKEDDFIYFAYNMHWENHEFDLPKLMKEDKWHLVIDTSNENNTEESYECLENQRTYLVKARTIIMLIGKG